MEEQVAGHEIVLVLNNIGNDLVYGSHLIGLQSQIYGCKVEEAFASFLLDFVFVDNRELG